MNFIESELSELRQGERNFKTIYEIMKAHFSDEIFGEELLFGRTVKTSYAELFSRAEKIAGALSSLSDKPEKNSFVALQMENSTLWVATFWGILMAGYRPALINMRMTDAVRASQKKSCGATLVLTDCDAEGTINAKTLLCAEPIKSPDWADELALFTSGTTGMPKTVIYNGEALCEQLLLSGDIIKTNPTIKHNKKLEIRQLAFLPFYHIFGFMASLTWFSFFGRTFIFLPDMDEKSIKSTCSRMGVTHFFAVPTVWERVTDKILREVKRQGKEKVFNKAIDMSNSLQNVAPRFGRFVARKILFKKVRRLALGETLGFAITGGGRVTQETLRIMNGLGYTLHNGYGMSEVGIVSVELALKSARRLDSTVGKPFCSYEAKIREDGALLLRGDGLYTAMIENGVRRERNINEYFVTRDLVRQNEFGRLEIVGRLDDMIIGPDGENISPEQIEEKMKLSGVHVCVLGANMGDGEKILFVSPRVDSEKRKALLSSLIFSAADTLPNAQKPRGIYFAKQDIPESNGKFSRTALKALIERGEFMMERAERNEGASIDSLRGELYEANLKKIKEIYAELLGKSVGEIGDNMDFISELGGDSLGYYTLMNRLSEAFGCDIPTGVSPLSPSAFAAELSEI